MAFVKENVDYNQQKIKQYVDYIPHYLTFSRICAILTIGKALFLMHPYAWGLLSKSHENLTNYTKSREAFL